MTMIDGRRRRAGRERDRARRASRSSRARVYSFVRVSVRRGSFVRCDFDFNFDFNFDFVGAENDDDSTTFVRRDRPRGRPRVDGDERVVVFVLFFFFLVGRSTRHRRTRRDRRRRGGRVYRLDFAATRSRARRQRVLVALRLHGERERT